MRIAYIAPYKGTTLLERRPVAKNVSLSQVKIELIARLLRSRSHEVDVISLGEVIEPHAKWYSGFYESKLFHPEISIYYSSALPIRYLNGFWSSFSMLRFFKAQHRASPYDLVVIFNLKRPHITCANYAIQTLGVPVILEYEDDSFVDVVGRAGGGWLAKYHQEACKRVIGRVSGGVAVSPRLSSQLPPDVPKLLLRGVLGDDIVARSEQLGGVKKNWVLSSGTHTKSNGIGELIQAWETARMPDWELHITGQGQLTDELRQMAAKTPGIVFHGLVSREELVGLLCSAKICINPHALSKTPGNVFAFKIVEYLGAGAHVITTPMGALEKEIEAGITYLNDNNPETIATTIREVIRTGRWEHTAAEAVRATYGSTAVANSLDALFQRVLKFVANRSKIGTEKR